MRNVPVRVWVAESLASGGTLTSGIINCQKGDPNYLMLRVTNAGAGTESVQVQFQVSDDGVNFNSVSSQDDIDAATGVTWTNPAEYHNLNCPGAPYLKLVLTDLLVNGTANVVDATLWLAEDS